MTIAGIEPQRGEGMFLLDFHFHPPLGVDSTDVCFSLTVPKGRGDVNPFLLKGFYLASVSVDTLSKITITNGALGWYQFL